MGASGQSGDEGPPTRHRPVTFAEALVPVVALILLVALSYFLFGDAGAKGPNQIALVLAGMVARTLETKLLVDAMQGWYDQLVANIKGGDLSVQNTALWDPKTWPREAKGVGFMEAPRGALAHYIVIKDGKIDNYQAVVPSTWNAGPRDAAGLPGPYEAALMDRHHLHDARQPLEIQRTIHSFDPCIACAVHVVDPQGEELTRIKVR